MIVFFDGERLYLDEPISDEEMILISDMAKDIRCENKAVDIIIDLDRITDMHKRWYMTHLVRVGIEA